MRIPQYLSNVLFTDYRQYATFPTGPRAQGSRLPPVVTQRLSENAQIDRMSSSSVKWQRRDIRHLSPHNSLTIPSVTLKWTSYTSMQRYLCILVEPTQYELSIWIQGQPTNTNTDCVGYDDILSCNDGLSRSSEESSRRDRSSYWEQSTSNNRGPWEAAIHRGNHERDTQVAPGTTDVHPPHVDQRRHLQGLQNSSRCRSVSKQLVITPNDPRVTHTLTVAGGSHTTQKSTPTQWRSVRNDT